MRMCSRSHVVASHDGSAARRARVVVAVVRGHPGFETFLAELVAAVWEGGDGTRGAEGLCADGTVVVLRDGSCLGVWGRHAGWRLVCCGCGRELLWMMVKRIGDFRKGGF